MLVGKLLQSHLCKGKPVSILKLILYPALGVVDNLWRQLVDPALQCGDGAITSETVEESRGMEGGGDLAAIKSIFGIPCEDWLDLVQGRLTWVTAELGPGRHKQNQTLNPLLKGFS